jgi:predicted ABC-type ATPase
VAEKNPNIIVIAGPNGAGKSTTAPVLLKETFATTEFVNADVIAQGLSGFAPENVALEAGRVMLQRLKQLAGERISFAFETTLASRSFAPWLREQKRDGYMFTLVFLWLSSADLAIERVHERVRLGGHSVPNEVVKRRYKAGITNFFKLYAPLADAWVFYDNSAVANPKVLAEKKLNRSLFTYNEDIWQKLLKTYK